MIRESCQKKKKRCHLIKQVVETFLAFKVCIYSSEARDNKFPISSSFFEPTTRKKIIE
jgi:hypothetical protein